MLGETKKKNMREFFRPMLRDFIDPLHELVILANKIAWNYFEKIFSAYYSYKGRPSVLIRLINGRSIVVEVFL